MFLPKNTTSILQPLDAGVIAFMKKRHQKRLVVWAIDLTEQGKTGDIYEVNLKLSIEWISEIWEGVERKVINSCLRNVELID